MIRLGSSPLQGIFKGGTPIGSVWCGDKLVYPDGPSYQRYEWLSAYRDANDRFNGFMRINVDGTNHVYQPRESLMWAASDLSGTWGSSYNDGYNWMAGAATSGIWRFTVTCTLFNSQPLTYPYIGQYINGGYMDQGAGTGGTSEVPYVTFARTYNVPLQGKLAIKYTFDITKPVTPRNWYFVPFFMDDASSAPLVFDVYDLVIGASKIA